MSTKKESALDSKTTLVDADKVRILNSADSTDSETITVQNFRDQLNEHIINIAANATSAEIVTAFTTAQNSKGARVTIQFADDTYTLSSNITVTSVPNLRILGNSADAGSGSGKAVVIDTGSYYINFSECQNVEFRYIEVHTDLTGSDAPIRSTNSNVVVKDYHCVSSAVGEGAALSASGDLGTITVTDSGSTDTFCAISGSDSGKLIHLSGNSWTVIDQAFVGLIVYDITSQSEGDHGGGWPYTSYGVNISAGTIRASNIRGATDSGGTINIQSDDVLTLIGSVVKSSTIYADTNAGAANVFIASDGRLHRSTSSIKYKTNVEDVQKSYMDNIIKNVRPVYYKDKKDPTKSYWGIIAEELALIDPRLVHFKTVEPDGEETVQVLDKDGSPRVDEKGNPITETRIKYRTLKTPEPEGVHYANFVVPLLFKVRELEARIKALEGK